MAEPASARRRSDRAGGFGADLSQVPREFVVMLTLVRKLLRDVRWALPVIMFLLFGFQALWVKATQRTTTVIAPMFQFVAQSQGTGIDDVKNRLFSGPARVMQTAIGGDQLEFQRAQDVLSIAYVHPLM